jgi:hypothetical protein
MARVASKDAGRVYVRASEQDRRVFDAVAQAMGLGEVSATLRALAYEKARELGLDTSPKDKPAKGGKKR